MNKPELVNWLQEEDRQWEALLHRVGLARMELPGVNDDWTMKDMIAHLTGRNRRLLTRLQAAARDEPEPPPPWPAHLQTDDQINAWIYEFYRGRSLSDVLEETRQVFRQLLSVVEELSEDTRIKQVHQSGRVYSLVWFGDERHQPGEFFDHFPDDHEPDVPTWLRRMENQ